MLCNDDIYQTGVNRVKLRLNQQLICNYSKSKICHSLWLTLKTTFGQKLSYVRQSLHPS